MSVTAAPSLNGAWTDNLAGGTTIWFAQRDDGTLTGWWSINRPNFSGHRPGVADTFTVTFPDDTGGTYNGALSADGNKITWTRGTWTGYWYRRATDAVLPSLSGQWTAGGTIIQADDGTLAGTWPASSKRPAFSGKRSGNVLVMNIPDDRTYSGLVTDNGRTIRWDPTGVKWSKFTAPSLNGAWTDNLAGSTTMWFAQRDDGTLTGWWSINRPNLSGRRDGDTYTATFPDDTGGTYNGAVSADGNTITWTRGTWTGYWYRRASESVLPSLSGKWNTGTITQADDGTLLGTWATGIKRPAFSGKRVGNVLTMSFPDEREFSGLVTDNGKSIRWDPTGWAWVKFTAPSLTGAWTADGTNTHWIGQRDDGTLNGWWNSTRLGFSGKRTGGDSLTMTFPDDNGAYTGTVSSDGNRITWTRAGSTWTGTWNRQASDPILPSLSGTWTVGTNINEQTDGSLSGTWPSNLNRPAFSGKRTGNVIVLYFPDDREYTGVVINNSTAIVWDNNGMWTRFAAYPPPAAPSLTGAWTADGGLNRHWIAERGDGTLIGWWKNSRPIFSGKRDGNALTLTLPDDNGGAYTGAISADGKTITFFRGSWFGAWTRMADPPLPSISGTWNSGATITQSEDGKLSGTWTGARPAFSGQRVGNVISMDYPDDRAYSGWVTNNGRTIQWDSPGTPSWSNDFLKDDGLLHGWWNLNEPAAA